MNRFGDNFRLSLWGESHGAEVGVVIDGLPAGIALSTDDFEADLARRRSGAKGTTPRCEQDRPHIVSGLYQGHTTGAPMAIRFENWNTRPNDYASTNHHPRPSHADLAAHCKWHGMNDPRGGGHLSGRMTVALVAAGVVAKKCLDSQITLSTSITQISGEHNPQLFEATIEAAQRNHDSLGGVVECRISGVKAGTGEPFFNSIESTISHLLFSIPAIKGVEFGEGFAAAQMRGSEYNDQIIDTQGHTATNHDGGINGGIANGNQIIVRAAFKPTPSIGQEQHTYNFDTQSVEPLSIVGRHDTCIALRGAVVVESVIAIALADLTL